MTKKFTCSGLHAGSAFIILSPSTTALLPFIRNPCVLVSFILDNFPLFSPRFAHLLLLLSQDSSEMFFVEDNQPVIPLAPVSAHHTWTACLLHPALLRGRLCKLVLILKSSLPLDLKTPLCLGTFLPLFLGHIDFIRPSPFA